MMHRYFRFNVHYYQCSVTMFLDTKFTKVLFMLEKSPDSQACIVLYYFEKMNFIIFSNGDFRVSHSGHWGWY